MDDHKVSLPIVYRTAAHLTSMLYFQFLRHPSGLLYQFQVRMYDGNIGSIVMDSPFNGSTAYSNLEKLGLSSSIITEIQSMPEGVLSRPIGVKPVKAVAAGRTPRDAEPPAAPALSEAEPAAQDAKSALSEAEPAAQDAKSALSEAEPAAQDAKSALSEAEPPKPEKPKWAIRKSKLGGLSRHRILIDSKGNVIKSESYPSVRDAVRAQYAEPNRVNDPETDRMVERWRDKMKSPMNVVVEADAEPSDELQ